MAFKGKRGLVLRTSKSIRVGKASVAKGTRVKFMAPVDKNTLKVKVQDKAYPKLRGEHVEIPYSSVEKVGRGRPAGDEVASKATTRKPAAKKSARKAPAKKAAATSVAGTESASEPDES